MLRSIAILATMALVLCGELRSQEPAPTRLPSIALPDALSRVLRDYEEAWRGGNEAALAALFTADGFVRARGGWIRGHDVIRNHYAGAGGDLRLRALAYAAGETVGYIVGAYGYGEEAVATDRGSFVLALRRDSPERPWLIAADLDHGN